MSVKRYTANKDNTITDAFKDNLTTRGTSANMGASDVLEVFSIYNQASSSVERSRALVEFPMAEVSKDRDNLDIPASGSVKFILKMSNAEHPFTLPSGFSVSVSPLIQAWDEGLGLDMEGYRDLDASNWISSSDGTPWLTPGGTYPVRSQMNPASLSVVPIEFTQQFPEGTEDLEIDVTPITEEWIRQVKGETQNASGSFLLDSNPAIGKKILIYSTSGDYRSIQISTSSVTDGKTIYVTRGANAPATATTIAAQIHADPLFSASVNSQDDRRIEISQITAGFYGNTQISSSISDGTAGPVHFAGGRGAGNYGLLLKLSGSFEDGTSARSYYTKKFFARGSQYFFARPNLEARYDLSIKDDRGSVIRSSSAAPAADNLNNIYLYNKIRGNLRDLPNTGSNLLVQLKPSLSGAAQSIVRANGTTTIWATASRESKGIYKATFAYSGSHEKLYDIWQYSGSSKYIELFTGSAFTINTDPSNSEHSNTEYTVNITNLKPSYHKSEITKFRIYTRDKNWKPNIYTVAKNQLPVNNIREAYYKITRVADNHIVVDYSTGSSPTYSRLSYDMSGSYFDLDMSILEPNYLYEISFLKREEEKYTELKERFKFRVDP